MKSTCNFTGDCAGQKTTISDDTILLELLESGEVILISEEEPFVTENTPTFAKFDVSNHCSGCKVQNTINVCADNLKHFNCDFIFSNSHLRVYVCAWVPL